MDQKVVAAQGRRKLTSTLDQKKRAGHASSALRARRYLSLSLGKLTRFFAASSAAEASGAFLVMELFSRLQDSVVEVATITFGCN